MRPYLRPDRKFMQEIKLAGPLGRVKLFAYQLARDVRELWLQAAPFPTMLKVIFTVLLLLLVSLPLVYPPLVLLITWCTLEGVYRGLVYGEGCSGGAQRLVTWWSTPTMRAQPLRELMARSLLLLHSVATSVDYLCMLQGLLDEL